MAKEILEGYETYDTSGGYGNAQQWRKTFHQRFTTEQAKEILQEASPYTILGVTPQATPAQIKKAFRTLIVEWHPDKNQHRIKQAEDISQRIIAAYSILTA